MTQTAPGLATTAPATSAKPMSAYLILGGAALLVLGSVLPWARVSLAGYGSQTVGGMDGDGPITLVLAVALGGLGWLHVTRGWHRVRAIGAIGCAAAATLTTLVDLKDVRRVAGSGADGFGVDVSVGLGLWIATAAAVLALAASVMAFRERPA